MSDRGPDSAGQGGGPGPVLGHPRGSESSNLDTGRCWFCYYERAKGYAACPTHAAKPSDTKRRATTCEDVKCPCVEASPRPTRPPPGICELWERDGRYFGKYTEDGPDVELSVAQPDTGLVRVLVDPAAAAEVDARTNAVATDTLRAYVTWGPASPENMLTFTTPDVWIVTPPRAGLPSRDEVAAFLEGRWPK